jgi:hypothetical protein
MSYGHQRPGRKPPAPQQAPWQGSTWQPPAEGYSAASPSMDLSNMAGINGASSYHGHGSDPRSSRFWHPDPDGEIPR